MIRVVVDQLLGLGVSQSGVVLQTQYGVRVVVVGHHRDSVVGIPRVPDVHQDLDDVTFVIDGPTGVRLGLRDQEHDV